MALGTDILLSISFTDRFASATGKTSEPSNLMDESSIFDKSIPELHELKIYVIKLRKHRSVNLFLFLIRHIFEGVREFIFFAKLHNKMLK